MAYVIKTETIKYVAHVIKTETIKYVAHVIKTNYKIRGTRNKD